MFCWVFDMNPAIPLRSKPGSAPLHLLGHSRNLARARAQFGHDVLFALCGLRRATNHSSGTNGRTLHRRVAPDRGFGGWGCPGPLALTGVGDQLTGAPTLTQSTHKPRVFDKNQTSRLAVSHWTPPACIRLSGSFHQP